MLAHTLPLRIEHPFTRYRGCECPVATPAACRLSGSRAANLCAGEARGGRVTATRGNQCRFVSNLSNGGREDGEDIYLEHDETHSLPVRP